MTDFDNCEMPDDNPLDQEIKELLTKSKTIAVVGLSAKPDRDSHKVARYLQEHGYTIIPVNPVEKEILGQTSYATLEEIPVPVDVVDIFRKPEAIPAIVDSAIKIKAKAVWMQLGLAHHDSAQKARAAGLEVVQSKCIKVEHAKLQQG